MILVSASFCFTLAVPMREVSCVEYTPRAWDPRSLQSTQNSPAYYSFHLSVLTRRGGYSDPSMNEVVALSLGTLFPIVFFYGQSYYFTLSYRLSN